MIEEEGGYFHPAVGNFDTPEELMVALIKHDHEPQFYRPSHPIPRRDMRRRCVRQAAIGGAIVAALGLLIVLYLAGWPW